MYMHIWIKNENNKNINKKKFKIFYYNFFKLSIDNDDILGDFG